MRHHHHHHKTSTVPGGNVMRIAFVNESTVVTDEQVQQCMAALQIQYDRDFAAIWELGPATLFFHPKAQVIEPGVWELVFADNSDQADALGYHEVTKNDDPIGFVFVKTATDDGVSWTATASHELLEMVVDPQINTIVEADNPDGSYTFYAKEVCDAPEDDQFGYDITLPDGTTIIHVSDFVTPNWFDQMAVPAEGRKYDFGGHMTQPFELLTDGYISVLDVSAGPQWGQKNGALVKKTAETIAPTPFHRRHRRMLSKLNWKRSERIAE
jgi:hypothetical protein